MRRVFKQKELNTFQTLCHLSQEGVLKFMEKFLEKYEYKRVIRTEAFVVGIGDIPVALCAHADTVFKVPPVTFFYDERQGVVWSPDGMGADDRAGIFAIAKIIAAGYKPHIIINTDEEIGCVGAQKLVTAYPNFPADLRFLIQLDRRGKEDSVYYDCANKAFEDYINSFGFITAFGSFTDISIMAPAWNIAAVNLSIGYEDEHFETEHLYTEWTFDTIYKVINILRDVKENVNKTPTFRYIPKPRKISSSPFITKGQTCINCNNIFVPDIANQVYIDQQEPPVYLCDDCREYLSPMLFTCVKCGKDWLLSPDERKEAAVQFVCEMCKGSNKDESEGDTNEYLF